MELLPFAEAVARLGTAPCEGNTPGRAPLVVVDLDTAPADAGTALVPPTGWPGVLVGVTADASRAAPAGPDVLLTETGSPSRPWVRPPGGLESGLQMLFQSVGAFPQAATTLAQVLRTAAPPAAVEVALVVESLAYATLQGGAEHRSWLAGRARSNPDKDPAPCLLLDRSGDTLSATLDRPARRNAYSARMRDELVEAFQLAFFDDTVLAVKLQGHGSNFCSGGDLAEFGMVQDTATAHTLRMARNVGWWIDRLHDRVTVHVHGVCVGAGVELPAFASRVIAAAGTSFMLPEIRMGLIPGAGGTASITRRIGAPRTAWLALSEQVLDAETALHWGLVDELVEIPDWI